MTVAVRETLRPQLPPNEFSKIGVNSHAQAARAKTLINTLGSVGADIAHREKEENALAYKHEFIHDEPVSHAHTYYTYDGAFYSYPLPHELVKLENGIHPGERNGRTIWGFKKLQEIAADLQYEGGVWYSPPGPAGDKAPFDKIHFDAGRLYLFIKKDSQTSIHLDIKIRENFPIKGLLDFLAGRHPQTAEDAFYYLDHPIGLRDAKELFRRLQYFAQMFDPVVYVSRRHDHDRRKYTLGEITDLVRERFILDNVSMTMPPTLSENTYTDLVDPHAIETQYYGMMAQFMQETGREELKLYGCSATTTISNPFDAASSLFETIETLSPRSPYGTGSRTSLKSSEDYKNDPNLCRCGSCEPHFHCPGKTKDGDACNHPIIVGQGITVCPKCGTGKIC